MREVPLYISYISITVLANFSFDPFLFEGKYTYMYIQKLNETLNYLNSVRSTWNKLKVKMQLKGHRHDWGQCLFTKII